MSDSLRPLKLAKAFSDKMEESGTPWHAKEHQRALVAFLNGKTRHHCRECAEPLKMIETGAMRCERCQNILDERGRPKTTMDATMDRINVPRAYRHCSLGRFEGKVPEFVVDFASGKTDRPLLLFGPGTGVGKTHLGTAILYSLANAGRSCWWESAVHLAGALSDEMYKGRDTFHKAVNAGVYLLDDLGKEQGVVPKAKELVLSVLDARLEDKRPTIITTNMTDEELIDYDARLASRLLAGRVVRREGKDHRWFPANQGTATPAEGATETKGRSA